MRTFKRTHSYLFLAAIVICSFAVHMTGTILWKDLRLISEPLHSTAEAIGAAIAVFMAIVLLWGKKDVYGGKLFPMAMGFLGMGLLDGFHAASSPDKGFVLLRSVAGLAGGFCFSLVWLPGLASKKDAGWKSLAPWIVAGGSGLFGIWTISARWTLPVLLQGGQFTTPAISINLIAGVLFAVSAVRFVVDFHRSESPELFLFASMTILFSIAQFSFPFSAPWDVTWWLWHVLRLMAFILVLGFAVFERKEAEDSIKKLNRDLQTHAAKLEASYRDLESFSYSASHDLRSPLIKIHAFSRILLKDYAERLDDDGGRLLNSIQENAKKMEQLINDLLAFSRVSTKEIQKSEISIAALTREVCAEFKSTIGNRRVQLEIKELPPAHCDESMMRQVFANLLSNAIKYTKPREIAIIEVGGIKEENENIYYVKDNGVGFDMENADKLFTIFQRLHSQEEFEGTGIGLVIVKRIVEKHGGRVWAEGRPKEGAKFYFALPVEERLT
ncbi:MAG: ATP-binding protein [Thermodesulfovibrionales bacterium]